MDIYKNSDGYVYYFNGNFYTFLTSGNDFNAYALTEHGKCKVASNDFQSVGRLSKWKFPDENFGRVDLNKEECKLDVAQFVYNEYVFWVGAGDENGAPPLEFILVNLGVEKSELKTPQKDGVIQEEENLQIEDLSKNLEESKESYVSEKYFILDNEQTQQEKIIQEDSLAHEEQIRAFEQGTIIKDNIEQITEQVNVNDLFDLGDEEQVKEEVAEIYGQEHQMSYEAARDVVDEHSQSLDDMFEDKYKELKEDRMEYIEQKSWQYFKEGQDAVTRFEVDSIDEYMQQKYEAEGFSQKEMDYADSYVSNKWQEELDRKNKNQGL